MRQICNGAQNDRLLKSAPIASPPEVIELFQAAIAPHQILLTILLVFVVCYWLLVIFGGLDFDSEMGTDIGDDVDAHHGSSGSVWMTAGRLFGFSQVPIIVWASFIILFMWLGSLALNESFNPAADNLHALALLVPNFLGSAILTKLATIPVAKLFKAMADADTEAEQVVGRTGVVATVEADETYGQLRIAAKGAPLLINVRVQSDSSRMILKKGDLAEVTAAGPDNAFYFVRSV